MRMLFLVLLTITLYSCEKDTTITELPIIDGSGNEYTTINVGGKYWLKENLYTRHYINGLPIATNLTDSAWSYTTSGAYQEWNGNFLYNFHALADVNKICPVGYHPATLNDWQNAINCLTDNIQEILIDSIYGGTRHTSGNLWYSGEYALFWADSSIIYHPALHIKQNIVLSFQPTTTVVFKYLSSINNGYSCKCVKD